MEEALREFVETWEAYWATGVGEGPSFKELTGKFNTLKATLPKRKIMEPINPPDHFTREEAREAVRKVKVASKKKGIPNDGPTKKP